MPIFYGKMKILRRYILREHVGPFVAALGVLTGLMLLNQLAKRFQDLVGKGLPWYLIAEVFGLSIPFILAMTMPMAVLVAVLYAFSRLASDNEFTAFKAGGVSLGRLMYPVLLMAMLLASVMIWFNDTVLPESNHRLRMLLSDIGRKQPTFELRERVMNEVVKGKLVLQAAAIDRTRSVLRDIVIFDIGRRGTDRVIYADSGQMAYNETQTDLYLTLYDGEMHEREANDPAMDQHTFYEKQVFRVSGVTNELQRGSAIDWRSDREMNIEMMQKEINERHLRVLQIEDSLSLAIQDLTPIRDRPEATESIPEREILVKPLRPGRDRPGPGRSGRPAPREDSEDFMGATEQSIRQRYRPSNRADWPPKGSPVAFAARMKNELKRIASRAEIHRREMNKYAVEIHKKIAIPAAAVVFVLIGAPIGARFPRGGIGMVIGVSLSIFCVYYVGLIGGENLADRDFITPFWGMWAPNVIFALIGGVALYLVSKSGARKLGFGIGLRRRARPRNTSSESRSVVEKSAA
jgi:lipopolysaccharide export system permease protein